MSFYYLAVDLVGCSISSIFWVKVRLLIWISLLFLHFPLSSVSSVAQLCLTLCNPMNCSMPGLPVHHRLLEFTQTHVHRVGDPIQPFHLLSSPSPPAPNPSQHQSLFQSSALSFLHSPTLTSIHDHWKNHSLD